MHQQNTKFFLDVAQSLNIMPREKMYINKHNNVGIQVFLLMCTLRAAIDMGFNYFLIRLKVQVAKFKVPIFE